MVDPIKRKSMTAPSNPTNNSFDEGDNENQLVRRKQIKKSPKIKGSLLAKFLTMHSSDIKELQMPVTICYDSNEQPIDIMCMMCMSRMFDTTGPRKVIRTFCNKGRIRTDRMQEHFNSVHSKAYTQYKNILVQTSNLPQNERIDHRKNFLEGTDSKYSSNIETPIQAVQMKATITSRMSSSLPTHQRSLSSSSSSSSSNNNTSANNDTVFSPNTPVLLASDNHDIVGLKEVMEIAARTAGNLMKLHFGKIAIMKTKSSPQDLCTEIDVQCQDTVHNIMKRHRPNDILLGEEDDGEYKNRLKTTIKYNDDKYTWIVDPIDGTTNFVHGLPLSVCSIAVYYKGKVVAGVIYDPYRDEMFSAVDQQGATLNNYPIHVSNTTLISDAVIACDTTIGATKQAELYRKATQEIANTLAKQSRGLRNFGAAALHMAYVAAGRLCGYFQVQLYVWDFAAGMILIREAGGKVEHISGIRDLNIMDRDVLCSNGHIQQAMKDIITHSTMPRLCHSEQV